jgi:hypothetical protein
MHEWRNTLWFFLCPSHTLYVSLTLSLTLSLSLSLSLISGFPSWLSGAPFVHGEDGLGDCLPSFEELEKERDGGEGRGREERMREGAVEFIAKTLRENPSVCLICLGPLTNIGRVVAAETERDKGREEGERGRWRERKVYIMGGTFYVPGNISPVAEAYLSIYLSIISISFSLSLFLILPYLSLSLNHSHTHTLSLSFIRGIAYIAIPKG